MGNNTRRRGGAAATDPSPAAGSWLGALMRSEPQDSRVKGPALKMLWVLGLVLIAGIGVMSLGDLTRPFTGVSDHGGLAATSSGGLLTGAPPSSGQGHTAGASGYWISVAELEAQLEGDLVRILSQIAGAGDVAVAVWLETSATYVYGYDQTQSSQETEEHDANGGTRVVTETNSTMSAVVVSQGSVSQPVVVRVDLPPVRGVVVVATGASDARVKAVLSQAVQTLLGLPAHQVVVLPGK